ncbi:WbqC family protein, partial [Rahnella bruchi]
SKAPYFKEVFPLIEDIIRYEDDNLFSYLHYSVCKIASLLNIKTKIIISSSVSDNENLKGQDKVLSICKALSASHYINAIGGKELYSESDFAREGIRLSFIQSHVEEYRQFSTTFVPWLSIADVLMFNSLDAVRHSVKYNYSLV